MKINQLKSEILKLCKWTDEEEFAYVDCVNSKKQLAQLSAIGKINAPLKDFCMHFSYHFSRKAHLILEHPKTLISIGYIVLCSIQLLVNIADILIFSRVINKSKFNPTIFLHLKAPT